MKLITRMKNLDSSVQQKIDQWLEGSYDENSKQEIRSLIDQEKFEELTDAFY